MLSEAVRQDLPHIVTTIPGPRAKALIERDHLVVSPSYTRAYPLVVSHGEGAMIEDVDGNRFLDLNAGIAVCATGHCHPEVVAAIQAQAARLIHMSGTDFYYQNLVELAEKLDSVSPGAPGRRVYFGNSGAEAVEAAMKLARYHTGRDKFIAFHGGFHGRTLGALSLTASKAVHRKGFSPLIPGVFHGVFPDTYRRPAGMTPEDYAVKCVRDIEDQLFRSVAPPEEVAAIVVEPVQGEGGYIVPPRAFFDELKALCARHGILLVTDEVQSGMGRTGRMWACEHFGVDPDVIISAKGLASGMPLGATIARRSVMAWKPGSHASTFGGNPVAIAAALATIDLLERELIANARRVGEYLLDRMREWPRRFRIAGDVRGLGLMLGVELVRDQESRERAPELRDALVDMAFERGLLILGCGRNTVRLCPPLVITRDQADFAISTLEECLAKIG